MKVTCDGKDTEYTAPAVVVIRKGTTHRLEALKDDTTVCCLHALHSRDNPGELFDPAMVPAGMESQATRFAHPIAEPGVKSKRAEKVLRDPRFGLGKELKPH